MGHYVTYACMEGTKIASMKISRLHAKVLKKCGLMLSKECTITILRTSLKHPLAAEGFGDFGFTSSLAVADTTDDL